MNLKVIRKILQKKKRNINNKNEYKRDARLKIYYIILQFKKRKTKIITNTH